LISSKTDIANWGSCSFQLGCTNINNILKYTNDFGGFGVTASTQLTPNDAENSFFDFVDFGGSFSVGDFSAAAAFVFAAKEGTQDSGLGFGIGADMDLGTLKFSADLQVLDKDLNARINPGDGKTRTIFTIGGQFGNAYSLLSVASSDNTPFYLTAGYTFDISDRSYFYTELQANQPDLDNEDAGLDIRGVYVFNFDKLRVSSN